MIQRIVCGLAPLTLLLTFPSPACSDDPKAKPTQDAGANLETHNLVAWCIVPFDAKKRGPAERAQMLINLGLKRCAYDWRAEHVATFEEEILQYQKHGIEYFAFWGAHDQAFSLFNKYKLTPQIWQTCPSPTESSQAKNIEQAAAQLTGLAKKTKEMGCKLGLYNHGGWGGEPANLVAVCKALHQLGFDHVGIVYNFHHGHEHIAEFAKHFALMKPYLHCLNLNGMADSSTVNGGTNKILPIGSGKHEAAMIEVVRKSGYSGPIGILDHIGAQDAAISLKANIDGLRRLLEGGGEK